MSPRTTDTDVRVGLVKALTRAHERMAGGAPAADFVDSVLAETADAPLDCAACGLPLERSAGMVLPCSSCVGVTIDQAHDVLVKLTEVDPEAMLRLLEVRVFLRPDDGIAETFAEPEEAPAPGAVVLGAWGVSGGPWAAHDTLGMLGLLNGLFGARDQRLVAIVEPRDGRLQLLGWEIAHATTGKPADG